MSDPLATYLHDHMAGSNFAVELLESMSQRYRGQPLGTFATGILLDIRQDQDVLKTIIEVVGKSGPDIKGALAWLGEKVSRMKLQSDGTDEGPGDFEALETLGIGILGKAALWRALTVIAMKDARLQGFDFGALQVRAQEQHSRVDEYRLRLARSVFSEIPA
jgi:hypothetical protein